MCYYCMQTQKTRVYKCIFYCKLLTVKRSGVISIDEIHRTRRSENTIEAVKHLV